MKTHSIAWSDINTRNSESAIDPISGLNSALQLAARAFIAIVPALAIVVGAAWLVMQPDLVIYLQAALWTSGLVFLGLAIDSQKPTIFAGLATGIALPVLAWLSSTVAMELAIVAAAIVAVWVAAAIFRK